VANLVMLAVKSGVLICNSGYCFMTKISCPPSMLSFYWPLNFRITYKRDKQPSPVQGLDKDKQNRQPPSRNKWRKNTTKTCSNTVLHAKQHNFLHFHGQ